jgi:hypothetical protein
MVADVNAAGTTYDLADRWSSVAEKEAGKPSFGLLSSIEEEE